jgi:DNA-binding response OmpR family regulator
MPAQLGRVLVVDDETQVSEMLRDSITYFGYVVQVAPSGEEALRALPTFRPDIILLDLTLPGISGEVVLEHVRRADPDVPVIMITGNSDVEVACRTLAQGAFDYIAKPFDLARLKQVLEAATASGR